jgi:hypothetical protein
MLKTFYITFPITNVNAESLFTFINGQWTDERNRVTNGATKGAFFSNMA